MIQQVKLFIRSYLLPDRLFLYAKSRRKKALFLTFDDGPVSGVTESLLDLLKEYNVKATFFVLGKCAEKEPALMYRLYNEGHTIANHSYSHPNFTKLNDIEQRNEVNKTNDIISQTTNSSCQLFRAPQGRWNLKLMYFLWKEKITAVHWNRDSLDFKKEPAEVIISRFKKQPVNAGDIILFHDDNNLCISVLSQLIPLWQSQGYTMDKLVSQN
ncbi:polysaccharide deacetylase family protein [Colwellia sp. E150_009]